MLYPFRSFVEFRNQINTLSITEFDILLIPNELRVMYKPFVPAS